MSVESAQQELDKALDRQEAVRRDVGRRQKADEAMYRSQEYKDATNKLAAARLALGNLEREYRERFPNRSQDNTSRLLQAQDAVDLARHKHSLAFRAEDPNWNQDVAEYAYLRYCEDRKPYDDSDADDWAEYWNTLSSERREKMKREYKRKGRRWVEEYYDDV